MRLDKPIGTLLLLWPTLIALLVASSGDVNLRLFVIFSLGALVMRSAGCVNNDLNDKDIDLIRLISPTTTKERIGKILTSSSGYLYYISLKGVTGSELKISDELENRVLEIKKQTKLPVVVGFGIKDAKTAKKMSLCSDGVVVGSKLVDEIGSFNPNKENILNQNLTSIISELKEGIS